MTMGVEMVESRRKAKAMKSKTDSGVAGRTMAGMPAGRSPGRGGFGVEGADFRDQDVRRATFYGSKRSEAFGLKKGGAASENIDVVVAALAAVSLMCLVAA